MYLMRLDDACEHWNKKNWQRIHNLLDEYHVKPLVAIIPHVEDKKLLEYPADDAFFSTINSWIHEGWTPALHGYNHVLKPSGGGVNPVNNRSEFAGLSYKKQEEKIIRGYDILKDLGIEPKAFVAPAHTFDKNTLEAIKRKTNIRVISDTVANDVYFEDGLFFIPQQSGQVRSMNFKIVTFCYHPNNTTEEQFEKLNMFLQNHHREFICFDDIELFKRKKSFYDKLLSFVYFSKRKIKGLVG